MLLRLNSGRYRSMRGDSFLKQSNRGLINSTNTMNVYAKQTNSSAAPTRRAHATY